MFASAVAFITGLLSPCHLRLDLVNQRISHCIFHLVCLSTALQYPHIQSYISLQHLLSLWITHHMSRSAAATLVRQWKCSVIDPDRRSRREAGARPKARRIQSYFTNRRHHDRFKCRVAILNSTRLKVQVLLYNSLTFYLSTTNTKQRMVAARKTGACMQAVQEVRATMTLGNAGSLT